MRFVSVLLLLTALLFTLTGCGSGGGSGGTPVSQPINVTWVGQGNLNGSTPQEAGSVTISFAQLGVSGPSAHVVRPAGQTGTVTVNPGPSLTPGTWIVFLTFYQGSNGGQIFGTQQGSVTVTNTPTALSVTNTNPFFL